MKSLPIGEEYWEEQDYLNLGKGVARRYGMNWLASLFVNPVDILWAYWEIRRNIAVLGRRGFRS